MARESRRNRPEAEIPPREEGRWFTTGDRPFLALLVLLAVVAHLPALRGGFIWDDDLWITSNDLLRSVDGLVTIWTKPAETPQWYPVTLSAFWVEWQVFGDDPAGYHVVNLLLHLGTTLLLLGLLRDLRVPGARFAALLFAIHPVQVETVAWSTELKNVLSTFLAVAAARAWFRFLPPRPGSPPGSRGAAVQFVLLFGLALLSKSVTASLPASLLLIGLWRRGSDGARLAAAVLVPLLVVGGAVGLLTVEHEKTMVGAEGFEWDHGFPERLVGAGRIVVHYVRTILWPADLVFLSERWSLDPSAPLEWLPLGAVVAALAFLATARRRIGTGPLVAALVYLGTLFPALGFFNVYPMRYSWVADHFQYLATPALLALLGATASRVAGRWSPRVAAVAAVVLAGGLAILSHRHSATFVDAETLWRATIARNPACWMCHNNLGLILAGRGRVDEAEAHYRESLRIYPDGARAHYNLALLLGDRDRFEAAEWHYRKSLALAPRFEAARKNLAALAAKKGGGGAVEATREVAARTPGDAGARNNHGVALAAAGRSAEAIAEYRAALQLDGANVDARFNLAIELERTGQRSAAEREYEAVVAAAPKFAAAWYNLALVRAQEGRTSAAVDAYRRVLAVEPAHADARNNLALLLLGVGRGEEALAEFDKLLGLPGADRARTLYNRGHALAGLARLEEAAGSYRGAVAARPGFSEAWFSLGTVEANRGRWREAEEAFREAARISPRSAPAHARLGWVRARQGNLAGARDALRKALEIDPRMKEARELLEQVELAIGGK